MKYPCDSCEPIDCFDNCKHEKEFKEAALIELQELLKVKQAKIDAVIESLRQKNRGMKHNATSHSLDSDISELQEINK